MIRGAIRRVLGPFMPAIPVTAGEIHAYVASTLSVVRWILLAFVGLVIILCVAYARVATKAPVVIRVDEVGNAATIADLQSNNAVQDVEVIAFSKDFLRSIVDINSYTIDKDLARALNMMTRQFQAAHTKKLQAGDYVRKIRKAGIQRTFEIGHLAITGRTDKGYELDVRGTLATKPFSDESAPPDKSGLLGQLYLLKVPRTELTPQGLLVSNFHWREIPLEEVASGGDAELKEQK